VGHQVSGCCAVGLTHRAVDQWAVVPVVCGGPKLPRWGRGTHGGVSPIGKVVGGQGPMGYPTVRGVTRLAEASPKWRCGAAGCEGSVGA
jgi:hypothetical protein